MAIRDVTDLVLVNPYEIDGEIVPVGRCICGHKGGWGNFTISIYRDHAKKCPECGRRLYYTVNLRVYEVEED